LEYLFLVVTLIVVLGTGFFKARTSVNSLVDDYNLVNEFHGKFIQMVKDHQQGQLNGQVYNWLVSYMDKVQVMLGSYGLAYYTGPYNRVQVPNYPYILNTIPHVRMRVVNDHDLMVCDDMLVRYLGGLKRIIEDEEKLLKKPTAWLQLGIRYYIGLPVRLLYWFGIISSSSFDKITSSPIFKIVSGIGALAGFLAALIQILQAWPFILGLF